jgi:hypothetical protein
MNIEGIHEEEKQNWFRPVSRTAQRGQIML